MKRTNKLGIFLKEKRYETQSKLTEAGSFVGISAQHLCNIERGVAMLPPKHIKKLAKFYNTSENLIVKLYIWDLISKHGWDERGIF